MRADLTKSALYFFNPYKTTHHYEANFMECKRTAGL